VDGAAWPRPKGDEQVTEVDTIPRAGIPAPTLQVIGPGFGRTGTLSLRTALRRLGFAPGDHMLENLEHPERFALWAEALRRKDAGEPIDWRPLLAGYRAIVDWPGAYFWRELVAAHPAAKVVLTVRDPARWYASVQATIFPLLDGDDCGVAHTIVRDRTFGNRFADRAHCQAVLAAHILAVRAAVPPERLLVFDVQAGWGPLCAFLGVPVPADELFPHVNDTTSFTADIQGSVG
jgi:sulfotransferase family protein